VTLVTVEEWIREMVIMMEESISGMRSPIVFSVSMG
jgi:hypothetical protein